MTSNCCLQGAMIAPGDLFPDTIPFYIEFVDRNLDGHRMLFSYY
jgi:hypothetical protein